MDWQYKMMLCGLEEETINHLFTQCVVTRFLLVKTQVIPYLGDLGDDVHMVWERWTERKRSQPASPGLIGLIVCRWVIWDLRNRATYRMTQTDPIASIYKVKQLTDLWNKLSPEK